MGLLEYYSAKTSRHRQNGLSYILKKILTWMLREARGGLKGTVGNRVQPDYHFIPMVFCSFLFLSTRAFSPLTGHALKHASACWTLLYDIINKYNLCVVNALRLCKGVFTRVNNKNSAEKSVLDYVIFSSNLSDNIQSMTIDEGKLFTPWRNLQRGKRFTDHNAIIFELQCERSEGNDKSNRKVVWSFDDDKGWEKVS